MINELDFRIKKNDEPYSQCFCTKPEFIENYDKAIEDKNQTWDCHHRLETHTSDGERRLVELMQEELIALGMYYNRPPEELIFLSREEHNNLHKRGKKREPFSEEWRRKLSESHKDQIPWNKGVPATEEAKRKNSEAHKDRHPSEEVRKKMSEAIRELHWYNNGIKSIRAKTCPEGFVPGRLVHKKISPTGSLEEIE